MEEGGRGKWRREGGGGGGLVWFGCFVEGAELSLSSVEGVRGGGGDGVGVGVWFVCERGGVGGLPSARTEVRLDSAH